MGKWVCGVQKGSRAFYPSEGPRGLRFGGEGIYFRKKDGESSLTFSGLGVESCHIRLDIGQLLAPRK